MFAWMNRFINYWNIIVFGFNLSYYLKKHCKQINKFRYDSKKKNKFIIKSNTASNFLQTH